MKKWSSDNWISLVAIVASIGTLFTVVYQTNLYRQQQYASVLPYLEMWNSSPGREGESYKYILINNGIGPALIREVKIHYQDSIYDMDPARFALQVIKPLDSLTNYTYSNIGSGRLVPAGREIALIGVEKDTINARLLRSWMGQTNSVQVEIIYESVYGERWSIKGLASEPKKVTD